MTLLTETTDEKVEAVTKEEYETRIKDFVKETRGGDGSTFVSQEVFRQTMDFFSENLRDLFSLIRDYAMERPFELEYKFGDISISSRCDHNDVSMSVTTVEKMVTQLSKKVFDKERLMLLKQSSGGKTDNDKDSSIYG